LGGGGGGYLGVGEAAETEAEMEAVGARVVRERGSGGREGVSLGCGEVVGWFGLLVSGREWSLEWRPPIEPSCCECAFWHLRWMDAI
jgi:hypothetical protein